jgi:acetoacetate decarboxylase
MGTIDFKKLTVEDILQSGFSTPWGAPMIPPYPFEFRDMEIMTLLYQTSPEAIDLHLPPPLSPISDVVMVHIYNMHDTDWIGPYNESNIMIGCQLKGADVAGGYSPYLFLNSAIGISHGREIQGQPKKYGQPYIEFRDDLIVGTIRRNDLDIFTGTMAYKQSRGSLPSSDEHFDFSTNINLKVIDHIDERPAIRQLTSRKITDLRVHECWSGPCTVELRPNAQAPLYRLPVVKMLKGFYWRADFTLVKGEIIYDYLE